MLFDKRKSRVSVRKTDRVGDWSLRRVLGVSLLLLLAAVGGVGTVCLPHARAEGDKIVASVNGEPIHESDIVRNIPADLMDDGLADLFQVKIDRLIRQTEMRQFLAARKVVVAPKEVEDTLVQLRKTPPSLGCACCRYRSLEQFLHNNGYALNEFRSDVKNQIGLNKYIETLWAKRYADRQSQQTLIASQRQRVEREYTRAWHIFFNTFQPLDDRSDLATMKARAEAKAQQAWQLLQSGQPFATAAKTMSEDQISKDKGGELGFIQKNSYGKDFADILTHLKPGEVSRPFKSIYGFHIVKWMPLHDDELLEICKVDFKIKQMDEVYAKVDTSAKVVRYDQH